MKLDDNRQRHWAVFALVAVAVVLGIVTLGKVAGLRAGGVDLDEIVASAQEPNDPNAVQERLDEGRKVAEQIKEDNLFVKAPPKQHPVKQVDGILGSAALIGNKWYEAGDKVGDANIVEVAATYVKVEWEGKETMLTPMGSKKSGPPAPPRRPERKREERPAPSRPTETKVEPAKVEAPPAPEDPFAWLGVELSDRAKQKLAEMWNKMPDEQKAQAKERWNNMSDEEKEKAVGEIEREAAG